VAKWKDFFVSQHFCRTTKEFLPLTKKFCHFRGLRQINFFRGDFPQISHVSAGNRLLDEVISPLELHHVRRYGSPEGYLKLYDVQIDDLVAQRWLLVEDALRLRP
jgi:hypothetical protein